MDETTAFPSEEYGPAMQEAHAKIGTVALPYPPPASGQLYLGTNPAFTPDFPSAAPKHFLRLVQTVSRNHVITRIVGLDELRGISLPASSTTEGRTSREFRTVKGINDVIRSAIDKLTKAETKNPGVHEVCLFDDAVIYVLESAPVFLRIQYQLEYGVTAAEAAEHVDGVTWRQQESHACVCPHGTRPGDGMESRSCVCPHGTWPGDGTLPPPLRPGCGA